MSAYVELHCHSCFSLLDGASKVEDLLARAAELSMPALALTDHDAVYGAVTFSGHARAYGIQPIFGAELTLAGGHHLTLLVEDSAGWSNLCFLITQARHNAAKGKAALPPEALDGHTDGLIALSGCRRGEIASALRQGDTTMALAAARRYAAHFGPENFYIELQHHLLPDDDALVTSLVDIANAVGVDYVATNNVHYAAREGHRLQDVLVCIEDNLTLDEAAHRLRPNSEFYLKSAQEMQTLFAAYPNAVINTRLIAERCHFDLQFGLQDLPRFPSPQGMTADVYLGSLCDEGLHRRGLAASPQARAQLANELSIIKRSGLSNYFLIVWDVIRFAGEVGIRCQGRGSAANSLAAYVLGISPINPLEHDLIFERFLSDERRVVPDIDIDFQADRREEVIQYIFRRYGTAHAAIACTFVTFRARSALRDIGKTLGLPPELLDRATGAIDTYRADAISESAGFHEAVGAQVRMDVWQQVLDLCRQIDGFPRHLSIHNGGIVVMGVPLSSRVPSEPARMTDRVVVQWDKDALEQVGLIKIDILGLRMLSAIAHTLDVIRDREGAPPDFDTLPFNDPAVYDMVSRADTVGVFQVESRAQSQVLPRLKPGNFNDIIVSISLIRPGPIQGNMVHPYLRRRFGQEPVTYAHPLLQPALEETLGVVLFQEQVLKVGRDLAGFTGGQGEQLRRALGSKRAQEEVERFHAAFLEGARDKGVEQAVADAIFDVLRAFGGYSFPKSHAASFAVLVYQSAWLKHYYPAPFYIGLLNNQPMGFWNPAVLVNDAKRHDLQVLPVEVNRSAGICTLEDGAIRLGLNYIKGFGEEAIGRVMAARANGNFTSLRDFWKRTRLPRRLVDHLIVAGAMDAWGKRRSLLWELATLDDHDGLDLVLPADTIVFPSVSQAQVMELEYEMLGLSLHEHPLALYRRELSARGILGSRQLPACEVGSVIQVAGLKVVHQSPPTAKGHHFVTLEDEDDFINVVVRPDIYVRYRRVLRNALLMVVEGEVQRQGAVINVVASQVYAME